MSQLQLPIFPSEATNLSQHIGIVKKDNKIFYFYGSVSVFSHDESDNASFKFITSQLYLNGHVKQTSIVKTFGVTSISVKRAVKQLREKGQQAFYKVKKGRCSHVLTPNVFIKVQNNIDKGLNPNQISKKLEINVSTIRKAIKKGRIHLKKNQNDKDLKKDEESQNLPALTKSDRTILDSQSSLGIACTRQLERTLASFGKISSVDPIFSSTIDVSNAGVICAIPALLANGLLKFSSQYFCLPKGYYGLESLLIILAFLALLRIKSLERVRYCDPGELGKLIGLDRIPEVKTIREKIEYLAEYSDYDSWSKELSIYWMKENSELSGILYVDGHVRVYYGRTTKIPKKYVSREKLCLRGITDYWVNDAIGQPFFVVSHEVNPGLIEVLRDDIVPRLLCEIPNQPSQKELDQNKYLHRFGIVFDREGYSPSFFKEMLKMRIACYTYKKYQSEDWPKSEFIKKNVVFQDGEIIEMELAERGTYHKQEKIWFREIRKLTESGKQIGIFVSDYTSSTEEIAAHMFSRWSQENFFKYMMEHFGIDLLIDYEKENMNETIKIINPKYREIESQIRSKNSKLTRKKAEYAEMVLNEDISDKNIKKYVKKKTELQEHIQTEEEIIAKLKNEKNEIAKHIVISELPESEKFTRFRKGGKLIIDTIKMIAYRSETALVNILREFIVKKDEARALIRQLFTTDADIIVNKENLTLNVNIHNMTNPRDNENIQKICNVLNESETKYPGTNLKMIFNLVSFQIPPDQEF